MLCRFTGREDTHAHLASIAVWGRPLTDAEVGDLARGGRGPQGEGAITGQYREYTVDSLGQHERFQYSRFACEVSTTAAAAARRLWAEGAAVEAPS